MNKTKLHQLQNNVEVVGVLKSKELDLITTKSGKNFMSGKLVVQSEVDGKINEHLIEVFIAESSNLFKGIQTVKNEYKTIDQDGIDNANRILVKGSLKLREFCNNQGNLIQYNVIRGMTFNRLGKIDMLEDKAVASIETVVEGLEPVLKDQLPTGDYFVKGFTVGWGEEVIEFKDVIVRKELAQALKDLYKPGSTGRLSFKLTRYAKDNEVTQNPSVGFGTTVNIQNTFEATKSYERNIEVIGGDLPINGDRAYTPELIALAKQARQLKLLDLKNKFNGSSIPETNTGFGQGSQIKVGNNYQVPTSFISPDDQPDF